MRFFLCLFYMFHRRYSNCRPLYSARYNRIICQRVENTSFFERLSCILHALAKGYQGYKSNFGFHVLSTAKSGKSRIKNPFLDSPKGTHPKSLLTSCLLILDLPPYILCFGAKSWWEYCQFLSDVGPLYLCRLTYTIILPGNNQVIFSTLIDSETQNTVNS